ncbi:MAG: hypothetical protein WBM86_16290 [Waterburya sp.]
MVINNKQPAKKIIPNFCNGLRQMQKPDKRSPQALRFKPTRFE